MEILLDRKEIEGVLPHRPPFLFVDTVVELEPGKRIVAICQVRGDEGFFAGHFPDYAVMPGVLIVEALAQTGAVAVLVLEEHRGKMPIFTDTNNVKFRGQVRPGDVLRLEVDITKLGSRLGEGVGKAFVGDNLVCEGEIKFVLRPLDKLQQS